MEIQLSNTTLQVSIKAEGAELSRIYSPVRQLEYLWEGNPKYWGRQSPILFPIVGQLKNDAYVFNGQTYQLPRHGFARDRLFECVSQDETSALFELKDDPESRASYPFPFRLQIGYKLGSNELEVSYAVENPGREPLPFSIGGHPAFRCPLQKGEKAEDYLIRFQQAETAELHLLREGLLSGETAEGLVQQQEFSLRRSLFENDALIFKHLKSDWVELRSSKSDHFVRLDFAAFPYLGIWGKPKAPFVCLEPWLGLADASDASGYLLDKEGIQVVMPGKRFQAAYRLSFG
jgi:galactose mutarotase-like enzyme